MDETTRTAIRAIIGALETSQVVTHEGVCTIVEQLRRAADVEADCERQDEAEELRALADDVEADARLD